MSNPYTTAPVVGHIVLARFPIGSLVRVIDSPSDKTWDTNPGPPHRPRWEKCAGTVLRVLRYSCAGYDTVGFYAGHPSGGPEVARVFYEDAETIQ